MALPTGNRMWFQLEIAHHEFLAELTAPWCSLYGCTHSTLSGYFLKLGLHVSDMELAW